MANMKSLQWIPRLLNAYIDAKVEYESNKRKTGQSLGDDPNGQVDLAVPQEARMAETLPVKQSKRVQPVDWRSSKPHKRKKTVPPTRTPSHVQQELRVTRRQLERLETIHQELARMQMKLDKQLILMQRKMGKKKSKSSHASLTKFQTHL